MIEKLKRLILIAYCKIVGHKEAADSESRIFDDKITIFKCLRCGQVTRIVIKRTGYLE